MSSNLFAQLTAGASARGRRKVEIPAALGRELTEQDLQDAGSAGSIKTFLIKDLRQSHHSLARLIASGEPDQVVSEITGYSVSRISILKSDPQFAELTSYYAGLEEEEHLRSRADFHQRLAAVGFDSIETLHQRVVEDPDSITTKELLAIVEASADRIGYGKTQTVNQNNVNVSLTGEELSVLRSEVTSARAFAGEANRPSEEDRASLLRLAYLATDTHSADEAEEGGARPGPCVREEDDSEVEGAAAGNLPSVVSILSRARDGVL